MMNMMQVMQQAQKMKKRLKEVQNELENSTVEMSSGNGAVTVTLSGQGKFKSIKIAPTAINPSNPESVSTDTVEMLEDLITEAMIEATVKAGNQMEEKMKAVTGGLPISDLF